MLSDLELSRRASYVLASAEQRLGIPLHKIPVRDRLEGVLMAAMDSPLAVEACEYRILHRLYTELGRPLPSEPVADAAGKDGARFNRLPDETISQLTVANSAGQTLAGRVIVDGFERPASGAI